MWPKALLELLPHLTRLVPMLNRYFQSKGQNDDATRIALERKLDEVAAALRKDMSEASAALPTADISRQLSGQSATLADIAAGTKSMQSQMEALDSRMTALEKRSGNLSAVLILALIQTAVVCVLLVITLYQLHSWVRHL